MSEIKYDENNQKYKVFDEDIVRDLSDDEKMVFKHNCFWKYCVNCNDYDDCQVDILNCELIKILV